VRDVLCFAAGATEVFPGRIGLDRVRRPEDLDGALLLLLSDAGRFITGITLPVDGGHLLSFL